MRDSQLQKMSLKQLLDLQKRIGEVIATRRIDERTALKKKIEVMAEQAGFQVKDLFGSGRERPTPGGQTIKYRHPKNRALIWTGRGRRPNWLVQEGGDIERFRVS